MEIKKWMRMKDLEKASGIPRSTIHFYLRVGLLHPPEKTGKTMAYYDDTHLERLKAIRKMKMDMKMPTAFIRKQLEDSGVSRGEKISDANPKLEEKHKRKQQIIDAAIKIFSQKGYHRANVRDITQAVGISTGTFYIYYDNKRDLFIEVVDKVIRNIIGEIGEAIRKEKDFEKRALLRARVFFDNYALYSEILNQLQAEMSGEDAWPREKVKKIYRELTEPLIREVRQAIELGVIRPVDPELLGFALIGLVEIMSMRATMDARYNFDKIVEFMVDLHMNGLRKR